jgi:hypothetical protein
MVELKTKQTNESVEAFLNGIEDEQKREDCFTLLKLMQQATREEPKMWGSSIVGFGNYHYKYATGREGDMPMVGFSPRKQNLTLYLIDCEAGFEQYYVLLKKLGKHSTGKVCLYIKRLADVDIGVLNELVTQSVAHLKASNPPSGSAGSSGPTKKTAAKPASKTTSHQS